jgi:hypothetical protein
LIFGGPILGPIRGPRVKLKNRGLGLKTNKNKSTQVGLNILGLNVGPKRRGLSIWDFFYSSNCMFQTYHEYKIMSILDFLGPESSSGSLKSIFKSNIGPFVSNVTELNLKELFCANSC